MSEAKSLQVEGPCVSRTHHNSSPEGAKDCSPGRKPWVKVGPRTSPERAKEAAQNCSAALQRYVKHVFGLDNAKLRLSRKLIFASGLLVCFSASLDAQLNGAISTDKDDIKLKLINHIRACVRLTPLEILARSIEQYGVGEMTAKALFGAYSEFLALLDDEKSREALKMLRASDSRTDPTFQRVREISKTFESALDHIFFENPLVAPLTRKYGVF